MNKIKIILLPALLISCLAFFAGAARADYTDYIEGVGVVTVKYVSNVGSDFTFNIVLPDGTSQTVSGGINENGRGAPDLSGVTTGVLANQTIEPPRVKQTTPLDSSARHDQYFTEEVAPGHSLVGYTPAGQTYYTDQTAVNTLAPKAEISLQELIAVAYRTGVGEISWEEAGKRAGINPDERSLTGKGVNDWLIEAGSSVRVNPDLTGVTREDLFRAITEQQAAASEPSIILPPIDFFFPPINGNGNGNGNGMVFPPPPVFPTCSSFSSNRQRILYNQKAELQWNCANVDSCSISPDVGPVGASGSKSVSPQMATTYTLTCYRGNQATSPLTTTIEVYEIILEETGVR